MVCEMAEVDVDEQEAENQDVENRTKDEEQLDPLLTMEEEKERVVENGQ